MNESATMQPGHTVPVEQLLEMGFVPLCVRVYPGTVQLPGGPGRLWDTLGDVPDGAGQYLFSQQREVHPLHLPQPGESVNVTYSGCTTHLHMVTRGSRPRPYRSCPGNRYGRPVRAGDTGKRVNRRATRAMAAGWTVHHWVRKIEHDPDAGTPSPEFGGRREGANSSMAAVGMGTGLESPLTVPRLLKHRPCSVPQR